MRCASMSSLVALLVSVSAVFATYPLVAAEKGAKNKPAAEKSCPFASPATLDKVKSLGEHLQHALGLAVDLLSNNQAALLSGNKGALLSGNAPKILSGNKTKLLSDNQTPILSGNKVSLFSNIKIEVHIQAENSAPAPAPVKRP